MKKVALFVDVQNIYYTTRHRFGCNFDYNKFWALATSGCSVACAIAYAIDRGDEKQIQFQNILRAIGFEVKLKPYIERADGSAKGDWDVGITIDILESANQADEIVLLSGDGDFDLLAQKVRNDLQKEFTVYGVPELTAGSLVKAASRFVAIDESLLMKSA